MTAPDAMNSQAEVLKWASIFATLFLAIFMVEGERTTQETPSMVSYSMGGLLKTSSVVSPVVGEAVEDTVRVSTEILSETGVWPQDGEEIPLFFPGMVNKSHYVTPSSLKEKVAPALPRRSVRSILLEYLDSLQGEIPDTSQISRISSQILRDSGREVPEIWKEALSHPVGVRAFREDIQSSVLWMARVMVTESNRASEWPLIGEVVRNRVEARFQGESEYRTVILDRAQFSHFNSRKGREEMEGVGYHSRRPGFQKALEVALETITKPGSQLRLPRNTFHYYSSVSMSPRYGTYCHRSHGAKMKRTLGIGHPKWAHDGTLVGTGRDPERFRFFSGV